MTSWLCDLTYTNRRFERATGIVCDEAGNVSRITSHGNNREDAPLNNRAQLPGLVNAHSHAFQRVIRGRTEHRTRNESDSFWTWREMMYSAATRLSPEDIYDASRMAFLEMALTGITTVGEFHYLHRAPDGSEYDDANLLAKEVVRAANDVGLRIALLRVAYARSGYELGPNPQQARFIEPNAELYLKNLERLRSDLSGPSGKAWVGIAPHSVRAVPLDYLKEIIRHADDQGLPTHMHVAEQPAEVSACIQEYGRSPVALLASEGLLSKTFTAVHAIHVTSKAVQALAEAEATVCACPTTERNLGDGVVPADLLFEAGIRISLGSDSHAQIDLLEDARELEYHLRLQKMERAVLSPEADDSRSALAARLFDCATIHGATSIGAPGGTLVPGRPADFFTVDLDDPSIAGAAESDLLAAIVFGLARTAVRDVVVGGKQIVSEGKHADQEAIIERFARLQKRLWS
ncbi:MAG: Formiminoglutamic iminohydrolase [Acidobacteria bacterium]|nr:Formiminoglutamic iminohydrolase [Acidobacteriota bacterium]